MEEKKQYPGDPYRTPPEPSRVAATLDDLREARRCQAAVAMATYNETKHLELLAAQNYVLFDIAVSLRKLVAMPAEFKEWAQPALKDLIGAYERACVDPVSLGDPCPVCGERMIIQDNGTHICKSKRCTRS